MENAEYLVIYKGDDTDFTLNQSVYVDIHTETSLEGLTAVFRFHNFKQSFSPIPEDKRLKLSIPKCASDRFPLGFSTAKVEFIDSDGNVRTVCSQLRVLVTKFVTQAYYNPDHRAITVNFSADGGTNDYNELKNKPQINGVEIKGSLSLDDLGAAKGNARALPPYLHEMSFDDSYKADAEAWYESHSPSVESGACSACYKNGKLGRRYDWQFDSAAEFVVRMSEGKNEDGSRRYASVGVASLGNELTEEMVDSGKYTDMYRVLPGRTVDGVNDAGVAVEVNVIPRSEDDPVKGDGKMHPWAVVRYVLDRFNSAEKAANYIKDHYYIPEGNKYAYHWMIVDKVSGAWIVEDGRAFNIDASAMTNFRVRRVAECMTDGKVDRAKLAGIDPYGTGTERWDVLAAAETVEAALAGTKWTDLYVEGTEPVRLSDFAEVGYATVDETEKLEAARQFAIAKWAEGERESHRDEVLAPDVYWWQSVHVSVYDLENKTLTLSVQEEDKAFVFAVNAGGAGTSLDEKRDAIDYRALRRICDIWTWERVAADPSEGLVETPADFIEVANMTNAAYPEFNEVSSDWWYAGIYWPNGRFRYEATSGLAGSATTANLVYAFVSYDEEGHEIARFRAKATRDPSKVNDRRIEPPDAYGGNAFARIATTEWVHYVVEKAKGWAKDLLPDWLTKDYAEPATVKSLEDKLDLTSTYEVWDSSKTYTRSYVVSHKGKIWRFRDDASVATTTTEPKAGSDIWVEYPIRDALRRKVNNTSVAPAFIANHQYKAGERIVNDGTLYKAKADFTSGAAFRSADWETDNVVSALAGKADLGADGKVLPSQLPEIPAGETSWGSIKGDLEDQKDLKGALAGKRGMTDRMWLGIKDNYLPITNTPDATKDYDWSSYLITRSIEFENGFSIFSANGLYAAELNSEGRMVGGDVGITFNGKLITEILNEVVLNSDTLALTSEIPAPVDVIDPASATTTGKAADALATKNEIGEKRDKTDRKWYYKGWTYTFEGRDVEGAKAAGYYLKLVDDIWYVYYKTRNGQASYGKGDPDSTDLTWGADENWEGASLFGVSLHAVRSNEPVEADDTLALTSEIPDVLAAINTHDTAGSAHADIRSLITQTRSSVELAHGYIRDLQSNKRDQFDREWYTKDGENFAIYQWALHTEQPATLENVEENANDLNLSATLDRVIRWNQTAHAWTDLQSIGTTYKITGAYEDGEWKFALRVNGTDALIMEWSGFSVEKTVDGTLYKVSAEIRKFALTRDDVPWVNEKGIVIGTPNDSKKNGDSTLSVGNKCFNLGVKSVAFGNETSTVKDNSMAVGNNSQANGTSSIALGHNACTGSQRDDVRYSHDRAFAWNGKGLGGGQFYFSKGAGTFCINPEGGLEGTFVGDKPLSESFAEKVDTDSVKTPSESSTIDEVASAKGTWDLLKAQGVHFEVVTTESGENELKITLGQPNS